LPGNAIERRVPAEIVRRTEAMRNDRAAGTNMAAFVKLRDGNAMRWGARHEL